jgi:hypothetical protein
VENQSSEVFLYILVFLLESRPFNKHTLENYEKAQSQKKTKEGSKTPLLTKSNRLIASPSLNSKFSPVITISKSPCLTKKTFFDINNNKKADKNLDILLRLSGKTPLSQQNDPKNILLRYANGGPKQQPVEETDEGVTVNNIPLSRKNRNPNLKALKDIEAKLKEDVKVNGSNGEVNGINALTKKFNDDLVIQPATRYKTEVSKKIVPQDIEKISKEYFYKFNFRLNIEPLKTDAESSDEESEVSENINLSYEGYLYKITETKKLKKLWFKLCYKDLYCNIYLTKIIDHKRKQFIKACTISPESSLKKRNPLFTRT